MCVKKLCKKNYCINFQTHVCVKQKWILQPPISWISVLDWNKLTCDNAFLSGLPNQGEVLWWNLFLFNSTFKILFRGHLCQSIKTKFWNGRLFWGLHNPSHCLSVLSNFCIWIITWTDILLNLWTKHQTFTYIWWWLAHSC